MFYIIGTVVFFFDWWCILCWQSCKESGVCKHNVLICMVDCWVLLGDCWWWQFGCWSATVILVSLVQYSKFIPLRNFRLFVLLSCRSPMVAFLFLLYFFFFFFQALCYVSCFRCGLCRDLRCSCVPYWYCHLLLSPVHNCNLICCHRSGNDQGFYIL